MRSSYITRSHTERERKKSTYKSNDWFLFNLSIRSYNSLDSVATKLLLVHLPSIGLIWNNPCNTNLSYINWLDQDLPWSWPYLLALFTWGGDDPDRISLNWKSTDIRTSNLLRSLVHTTGDDDVPPGRWPQLSPLSCCCQASEITDNTHNEASES